MANNPIYNQKFINVSTGASAATTALNSTAVDMQGWDGVVFLGRIATAATSSLMNAAQATATGVTFNDLAGTAIRNKTHMRLDIYKPAERYVRAEIARGASVALGDIWAVQYNGKSLAVAATDNVGEFHAFPTEGTA